ncbi:MAG: ATP-binding protein [Bdellovibrionia bacterium]
MTWFGKLMPENLMNANPLVKERAKFLFVEGKLKIYRQTDRLFAGLMVFQWLLGISFSLLLSPKSWAGATSVLHFHVWAAILLGGTIVSLPIGLALAYPGRTITRHIIAGSQMLMSALLIHLSGGRIETHFHIFGSLAFLAFYRDSPVLITGSIVVALDHYLRGIFWPQSVFGVLNVDSWRWLEHAAWVVFEDIFLIYSCLRGNYELREIAVRQAELETANDDLERFAAIAAHDLRSPIATISSTVEAIRDNIQEPSAEVEHFFSFVNTATENMLSLIEKLLTYASIGKSEHNIENVDLNKVVEDVLANLGKAISDSHAKIIFQNLPTIKGDALIVGQLFQNLISNSIKFRDARTPIIEIRLEKENEREYLLSLKDNGIGFKSKQAEIIFEPFKRLESARKYEGSGLGLSTAKRVVEMLGGRIWAESEEGKGTKFFFTVSK